jgi:hypothetical protein
MDLRLVTEDPETYDSSLSSESYVLFATGDGPDEDRVCKGFAAKFDGNRVSVLSFKSPLPRRITGISSLEVVKVYVDKSRVKRLLWTCDKEHVASRNNWIDQVIAKLATFGIAAVIDSQWNDAARFDLVLAQKHAVFWCALTGIENYLEENLAALIKIQLQENVVPNKREIHAALERRGINIEELIRQANRDNLQRAIPSLFKVFEDIEEYVRVDV